MTDRPEHRTFEKGWDLVRWRRRRQFHVLPTDDTKEHVAPGLTCWCQPKIERYEKGTLISHNAADGRELVERHGVQ